MLDHVLGELTGRTRPTDAWAALFGPQDVVGIKPNARGGDYCSPSPALLDAVIARLRAVGVSPRNILIWELGHVTDTKLWKHLQRHQQPTGVQVRTQEELGLHSQRAALPSGGAVRFNRGVHRVSAIINIATFKDHSRAGVTGALKNLAMGCVDHPRSHHANSCNPGIPEIYGHAVLRSRVRLTLADASRLIYERGPTGPRSRAWNVPFHRLYATTDPVALDRHLWEIIDGYRKKKGLPLLMKRGRGADLDGRPIHVPHAAKLGLGEAELSRIRLQKKTFG
jgi:uncharacterized protein (DUF362 family)